MANTGAGKIQAIEDEQLKIENDTTELVLEFEKKMIRELRSQYEQATIEVQAQVQGSTRKYKRKYKEVQAVGRSQRKYKRKYKRKGERFMNVWTGWSAWQQIATAQWIS